MGIEVVTIVAKELLTDSYQFEWDASMLPNGFYYYIIKSGALSDIKKLIIQR